MGGSTGFSDRCCIGQALKVRQRSCITCWEESKMVHNNERGRVRMREERKREWEEDKKRGEEAGRELGEKNPLHFKSLIIVLSYYEYLHTHLQLVEEQRRWWVEVVKWYLEVQPWVEEEVRGEALAQDQTHHWKSFLLDSTHQCTLSEPLNDLSSIPTSGLEEQYI